VVPCKAVSYQDDDDDDDFCVNLLTWHADSGQLHVKIEPGGAALKLRATSHSCYVIRCVRPGRVLGLAAFKGNGPSRVLGQTTKIYCTSRLPQQRPCGSVYNVCVHNN